MTAALLKGAIRELNLDKEVITNRFFITDKLIFIVYDTKRYIR